MAKIVSRFKRASVKEIPFLRLPAINGSLTEACASLLNGILLGVETGIPKGLYEAGAARVPVVVVSHTVPQDVPAGSIYSFVNGVEAALETAKKLQAIRIYP
jgi:hypothetical protein